MHATGYELDLRESSPRADDAVLLAVERACRDRSAVELGLSVHGPTDPRPLHERAGFAVTAQSMAMAM